MNTTKLKEITQHCGGAFLPILANVHVYATATGNRVQAGNGRYTVDAPCTLPVLTVNADRLLAALSACQGDPEITITDASVMVKAGKVRARLPMTPTEYPVSTPVPVGNTHLEDVGDVLKWLEPFAAEDASRPWATSICLSGNHAYATNNVALVRAPLPVPVPIPVNIPATVVLAVVQRGPVIDIGCDGNSVTFYYADSSWVNTGLISGEWPTHVVDGYVDGLGDQWEPVHESLSSMLATATKIATDKHPQVQFGTGGLSLLDGSFEADDLGALPEQGKVNAKMAAMVFAIAEEVQWHTPKQDVHAFRAGSVVGIMGGTR